MKSEEHLADIDYELLSFIVEKNVKKTTFSQREIANALKISLGMTNNILKKVLKKGLVLASKLDGRKLNYVLTRQGMKQLYSKSLRYLKDISKNAYQFKDIILKELENLKDEGYTQVILLGESSLDFIIEYSAMKSNLKFKHITDLENYTVQVETTKTFYFISEQSVKAMFDKGNKYQNSLILDELILNNLVGVNDNSMVEK